MKKMSKTLALLTLDVALALMTLACAETSAALRGVYDALLPYVVSAVGSYLGMNTCLINSYVNGLAALLSVSVTRHAFPVTFRDGFTRRNPHSLLFVQHLTQTEMLI